MTQEEKAKAYDEAFGRAKALYAKGAPDSLHLEEMFPELKESEDERIKNFISHELACLRATDEKGSDRYEELTNAISWLEKQGHTDSIIEKAKTEKQRVIISETDGYANIDWDTRNLEDARKLLECGLQYINTELEKQGEQKPADKVEPKFKAGDFIADGRRVLLVLANKEERNLGETYSTYCEGLVLDVYGDVLADDKNFTGFRLATNMERANFVHDLKVGTKINYKPAEWTEEDEKNYNTILKIIRDSDTSAQLANKLTFWIESLKPQPKQEWSEEDERMINSIIKNLDEGEWLDIYQVDWLKSLKEQPHWKPSDGQMKVLKQWLNEHRYDGNSRYIYAVINSLYEQLKSL